MHSSVSLRIRRSLTLRNVGLVAAVLVMVMMVLLAAGVPDSHAAATTTAQNTSTIFKVGKDIVVPAGDVVDGAVAIGGDITIDGTVTQTVVAIGGNVTVNGTVKKAAVAVGGDVTLAPGASVGSAMKPTDSSIVAVGGKTTVPADATVTGKVTRVEGLSWSGVGTAVAHHGPWTWTLRPFGILGGLASLLLLVVAALIAAAALPKQMGAVKEQVNRRFFPSLGWGALTAFIIIPALVFVLVISIIGIIPLLIVVVPALLLISLFSVVCVGGAFGDLVFGRSGERGNPLLVALVGVLILGLAAMIPFIGTVIMAVAGVIGLGGTLLAIGKAQRERRERTSTGAAGTPGPSPAGTA